MRIALAIAALLLASPASARPYHVKVWTYCDDDTAPPAEFDYEPNTPYSVVPLGREITGAICMVTDQPSVWQVACTIMEEGNVRVIVRDDLSNADRACVMRHERAHINGWVHEQITPAIPLGRIGAIIRYMPKP